MRGAIKKSVLLLLAAALVMSGCFKSKKESTGNGAENVSSVRLQDDLYQSVNEAWLKNSVIPADQPIDSPMLSLDKQVTQTLIKDFKKMIDEKQAVAGPLGEFLKLYQMQLDTKTREALGTAPLKPFIEKIEGLGDLKALDTALFELTMRGFALPFNLTVTPDIKNSAVNVLAASPPGLLLASKEYYTDEAYAQLSPVYSAMMQQIFVSAGKTEAEAKKLTEQAMAFDKLLAPLSLSMEEQSSYATLYSEVPFSTFAGYSNQVNFEALVQKLIGQKPDKVMLVNQKYFEALNQIVTPQNFENMKSWMIYQLISAYSSYLNEEMDVLSRQYAMALYGVTQIADIEERNYGAVQQLFAPVTGQYYGKTYFGDAAKNEANEITKNIIEVYRQKLQNNDWLSKETKEKALLKLGTLQICMGFPDDSGIDPVYSQIKIDPQKSLIENLDALTQQSYRYIFSNYGKPHNKNIWTATGDTVNAFYNPVNNSISFTAAIMQPPFYSTDMTLSEKYGAFGSVVGHEISHAFDPNGALFDENGNLANWWTEADYAAFEKRTEAVKAQFDGLEYGEGQVNATLTNSENVADNAGIRASLDALKKVKNADLREFFVAWAKVWRINATPEYQAQLLILDNHAPSPLRVNVPVSNFDEFYDAFEVGEGDKMFRPKEQRVFVW